MEFALGPLDADFLADGKEREVAGNVALFICLQGSTEARHADNTWTDLHDQVKVPLVIVQRHRCVTPDDLLAVDLRIDLNVLSHGKTERVVRVRKLKNVSIDREHVACVHPAPAGQRRRL